MKSNRRSFFETCNIRSCGGRVLFIILMQMNHLSGRPILKMINRQTLYMEVHYPPVDHFFNNSTPGRVNASGIIDIHSEIKINEPFHGAILNWRHGERRIMV